MNRTQQQNIQDRLQEDLRKANYNGYGLIATGVGKTRIAINIHEELKPKLKAPVLLLTSTEHLRDEGWLAEYRKWDKMSLYEEMERACYMTSYKWTGRHFGLVIADEVDVAATIEYSKVFQNNTWDHLIGLTAHVDPKLWQFLPKLPVAARYTFDQAVADGVVSPYEIITIPHQMTLQEEAEYKQLTAAYERSFYSGNPMGTKFAALRRARFLYNLPSKVKPAQDLLVQLADEGSRVLLMSESTQLIDQIVKKGYHSNNPHAERVLQKFLKGDLGVIGSAKKLNRGANVGSVQAMVMASYSSSVTAAIQRFGRVCRFEENKLSKIYIFVTTGTQEEVWISKLIDGLKK